MVTVRRGTTWTTGLTLLVSAAWMVSLIARTLVPGTAVAFTGLDAVVLVIIGYWFSSQTTRRNGNGS